MQNVIVWMVGKTGVGVTIELHLSTIWIIFHKMCLLSIWHRYNSRSIIADKIEEVNRTLCNDGRRVCAYCVCVCMTQANRSNQHYHISHRQLQPNRNKIRLTRYFQIAIITSTYIYSARSTVFFFSSTSFISLLPCSSFVISSVCSYGHSIPVVGGTLLLLAIEWKWGAHQYDRTGRSLNGVLSSARAVCGLAMPWHSSYTQQCNVHYGGPITGGVRGGQEGR